MSFINIKEYILLSKIDRSKHLDLNESCIEIGGASYQFKGMMAHILKTTIPIKKDKIHLCHACHNGNCSNPKHLYWGTMSENVRDSMVHGSWKNPRDRAKEKYGNDYIFSSNCDWASSRKGKANAKKLGKKYGGRNKLSDERIEEIKTSLDEIDVLEFGWVQKVAERLDVSHTQVKRYVKKYFSNRNYFTRKKISVV